MNLNTTSVIHFTVRESYTNTVHVYVVPDARLTPSQRRELDDLSGDEADFFEFHRTYKSFERPDFKGPIVGNLSHVYWLHSTETPDSVRDLD